MSAAQPGHGSAGQEALREAARLESARVYGRVLADTQQPRSVTVAVAEAELIARWEALANLSRPATRGVLSTPKRVAIEQAIARGWDDTRTAQATGLDAVQIATVRAAMDKAAS